MTMGRWRHAVFTALMCLVTWTHAQDATGRIEGRIVKDGEGVPAVVVLVDELKLSEFSDGDGNFVFEKVPVGTYTLVFTLGNQTEVRPNVIVTPNRTHSLTLEVEWEVVTEKVRVTAAAQAAKIVDAPSAVTSIPEVQIEKQASHGQVPKILEFTPGAEVTQSGLYDFNFNTRGFNSSLNRRVSTYIDGRDVGVVLLGAQEWAAIAGGLDDVSSLEFIRGPSAALYGANASSGVINITTKAPRDSIGTLVRVSSGSLNTQSVDFRRSAPVHGGWYAKVIGGFKNSGDFSISRDPNGADGIPGTADDLDDPEYVRIEPPWQHPPNLMPPHTLGGTEWCTLIGEKYCIPKEKRLLREQDNEIRYGSVRFDKYLEGNQLLTFEAGVAVIKGPVFQTGIGRVQIRAATRPFYRVAWSNPHWNVLAHHSSREGQQVNLTKDLIDRDDDLITDTQRTGIEAQGYWNFGGDRGRFVIGAAHTSERVDTAGPWDGLQTVVYEPVDSNRQAIFSQVDWEVNKHLKFVGAGRVDWNTLHDTQFSPKAAMVWSINEENSIRLTFNEAFQVANYSEFFLHAQISAFPIGGFVRTICENQFLLPMPIDCGISGDFIPILAVGNDDLRLEKTSAWEIGYSGLLANRVFVTVDYYNSDNEDFITDLVPQVGTILGNTDGCNDIFGNPTTDPTLCPINTDYLPWVSTPEAENTPFLFGFSVAQSLRNAVEASVGGSTLGFRLAQDLDGSPIVVGRTYSNVGKVETQGVDFGLQYFVNEAWQLQASYSWFDFDITEPDPAADARIREILLPNSPEHKASLSVAFAKDRWSVSLAGRWVEGFLWTAGVFQGSVDDYSTIDLNAGVAINELVSVGLNVANLRDTVHRQTFGGDLLSRRALVNLTFQWK